MKLKLHVVLVAAFCLAAGTAKGVSLFWGKTHVKTASAATCMSFAGDTMRALKLQNIRKSADEVAGTSGGTYAAITCVATAPQATAIIMVAGQDNGETMRMRDALRNKIAGMIRFD